MSEKLEDTKLMKSNNWKKFHGVPMLRLKGKLKAIRWVTNAYCKKIFAKYEIDGEKDD